MIDLDLSSQFRRDFATHLAAAFGELSLSLFSCILITIPPSILCHYRIKIRITSVNIIDSNTVHLPSLLCCWCFLINTASIQSLYWPTYNILRAKLHLQVLKYNKIDI